MPRLSRLLTTGLCALAAACLVAVPASAGDRVIYNGIDLWVTPDGGFSSVDFSQTPIPSGFFCEKAGPFTGRIALKGVPIVTSVPGALGRADTIVQRLDDAVFNKKGIGQTRLQVRALSLESIAPIKTACGLFTAKVSLDGEQPITRMRIIRESSKGGRFRAPLALNVRVSFAPVEHPTVEPLEIRKSIRFPTLPNLRWSSLPAQNVNKLQGFLLVDTDGDRSPDTYLPGTSNFGVGEASPKRTKTCRVIQPYYSWEECHDGDGCVHCVCYYE
jgi:hypothetical protein